MAVLRIGTRGSALARWQADRVGDLLAARGVEAAFVPIRTSGDATAGRRRAGLAVKGLFTKEIEQALLDRRVDIAVHSLKDLLLELPPGLVIAAVPEREDPRDALVTRDGRSLLELEPGARIGTSSLRRRAAVASQRPDVEVVPLVGNVTTRVKRVEEGSVDAAVLALAGLKRLRLDGHAVPLDPAVFVPAPGQGALAVEARADDDRVLEIIAPLDDMRVRHAIEAERSALAGLGSGCNVPVGAHASWTGRTLTLQVAVYAPDGGEPLRVQVPVKPNDPAAGGAMAAARLLEAGASALMVSGQSRRPNSEASA
ncbi:MAG: hydroxymethylbilane synthase [Gemmatimonadales bacterium]|nr:hydroxymethylbilane synthase [Gemmatimonadales bacterium]NIN12847.1 hydroxymethylbilane synthase [Gemmatimonadales bacterium]NIN51025.1 hydroxymethylbilane synthase [Gemmatimonadales bacterium]NIP08489.1 hydroxymethylbilane synthase [Gemmatimonadales bacterium]NIR02529.1 hydroxymethylbilane synthase [Gemmatimonadales bacterium]